MRIELPDYVKELMAKLSENGFESFVVGGAIRDTLLGITVHDYDLATNALPDEIQEIFKDYYTIPTGIRHGTLTVMVNGNKIEITTYRKDSIYDDHRHPNEVTFSSSIHEDCARRDFTINAFAYNETDGFQDFYDGLSDLEKKLIRCIRDPYERFDEDALRILRAIRFSSQLGFQIEEETAKAIHEKKNLLSYISHERIHDEVNGILAHPCSSLMKDYYDVFSSVLPALSDYSSLDEKGTTYTRLALLLEETNYQNILKEYCYANKEIQSVENFIQLKDAPLQNKIDVKKVLSLLKNDWEDYLDYRYAKDTSLSKDELMHLYKEILENKECYSLSDLSINGDDVTALGYRKQEISNALHTALNAVIEEKVENKKEVLIDFLKNH